MLLSPLLLLMPLGNVPVQEKPPEEVTLNALENSLREFGADRYTLMQAFAARKDAPEAIPSLLETMKDQAPKLDNDVCLAVLKILKKHPAAKCPLDPLLDVVRRRVWNSQQKGSLALFEALRDQEAWKGREEELEAALIPLLTSQRSRVYESALKCLERISGRTLPPDPEAWRKVYETAYPGKSLDLGKAVIEILAVIHPSSREPFTFELNGEVLADGDQLAKKLSELAQISKEKGVALGIVVQTPGDIQDEKGEYPPGVKQAIQALVNYSFKAGLQHFSYTVSPGEDVFRAPYVPKAGPRRGKSD